MYHNAGLRKLRVVCLLLPAPQQAAVFPLCRLSMHGQEAPGICGDPYQSDFCMQCPPQIPIDRCPGKPGSVTFLRTGTHPESECTHGYDRRQSVRQFRICCLHFLPQQGSYAPASQGRSPYGHALCFRIPCHRVRCLPLPEQSLPTLYDIRSADRLRQIPPSQGIQPDDRFYTPQV